MLAIIERTSIETLFSSWNISKKKLKINAIKIVNNGWVNLIGSISEMSSFFKEYITNKFAKIERITIAKRIEMFSIVVASGSTCQKK